MMSHVTSHEITWLWLVKNNASAEQGQVAASKWRKFSRHHLRHLSIKPLVLWVADGCGISYWIPKYWVQRNSNRNSLVSLFWSYI
jgi:hypothetical protein